jgi:hypothetical protein
LLCVRLSFNQSLPWIIADTTWFIATDEKKRFNSWSILANGIVTFSEEILQGCQMVCFKT